MSGCRRFCFRFRVLDLGFGVLGFWDLGVGRGLGSGVVMVLDLSPKLENTEPVVDAEFWNSGFGNTLHEAGFRFFGVGIAMVPDVELWVVSASDPLFPPPPPLPNP